MKKFGLGVLLAGVVMLGSMTVNAATNVPINSANFPDVTFRNYVKEYDYNNDNVLSENEAKSVTNITLQGKSITSLKGIEYFTELTYLDCCYNNIAELNLSKNTKLTFVRADNNKYTSLDVSMLPDLEELNTGGFSCKSVNLNGCKKLKSYASGAVIESLDLSTNIALEHLTVGGTVNDLDLSHNTNLKSISVGTKNMNILDVSKCTSLTNIYMNGPKNLYVIIVPENAVVVDKNDNKNLYISNSSNISIMYGKLKYSNEWIDGWWYNEDGSWSYPYELSWAEDDTGWWVEDTSGWYPTSSWQKIDYKWYYFGSTGYMCSDEYISGYYINKDGTWTSNLKYSWEWDGTGWKYQAKYTNFNNKIVTTSIKSNWCKIDDKWYYFDKDGYMLSNQYVDGYWLGADGACE